MLAIILAGLFSLGLGSSLLLLLHNSLNYDTKRYKKKFRKDSEALKGLVGLEQGLSKRAEKELETSRKTRETNRILGKEDTARDRLKTHSLEVVIRSYRNSPKLTVLLILVTVVFMGFMILMASASKTFISGLGMILSTAALCLLYMAILNSRNRLKDLEFALEFMNMNVSSFLTSPTFDNSVEKNLTSLQKGTPLYKRLRRFIMKVKELNYDKMEAIDDLKADMNHVKELDLYLEIVKKVEVEEEGLKYALQGLPEVLQPRYEIFKDYVKAVTITSLVYLFTYSVIFIMSFVRAITITGMMGYNEGSTLGIMIVFCYFVFAFLGFLLFMKLTDFVEREG